MAGGFLKIRKKNCCKNVKMCCRHRQFNGCDACMVYTRIFTNCNIHLFVYQSWVLYTYNYTQNRSEFKMQQAIS